MHLTSLWILCFITLIYITVDTMLLHKGWKLITPSHPLVYEVQIRSREDLDESLSVGVVSDTLMRNSPVLSCILGIRSSKS
ncbi:hypothetical protein B0H34DRAFT_340224 [Crassisporium funariophilum]|nr:hypothetical protein B0H34DRAFT_340224 [Crassisporium funariophilum]